MRLLASLLLVGFWIAIAFAALLISTDPETESLAEHEGADTPREAAVADEASPPDEADVGEAAGRTQASADEAEAPEEEEAEEVFQQAELDGPEFQQEPEEAGAAEAPGDAAPGDEAPVVASLGDVATALPSSGDEPVAAGSSLDLGPETSPPEQTLEDFLTDEDVALYREIFRLQGGGRWRKADGLIKQLDNKALLGHVLAQRYLHPTAYRSKYRELRSWLAKYGDHPGADKVYKLAISKRQPGGLLPRKPRTKKQTLVKLGLITKAPYKSKKRLTRKQRRRVRNLRARMYRLVDRRALSATEKLIASKEVQRLFDDVQLDEATSWAAAGWFYIGKYEQAFELAQKAARRSGNEVPLSHWITGLAAWRLDDLPTAALHFEALALSPENSGWNDASGPYWAARVHERLGHLDKVDEWLERAAAHPRALYGMIARHRLGLGLDFDFSPLRLDARRIAALSAKPGGARALAFLRLGEHRRVEKELNALEGWREPAVAEAIMAVAEEARLPALSLRIAKRLAAEGDWDQSLLDAALYPVPAWEPRNGFKLDRALVYAVIRQESQFKHYARSRDGARGLMQLLPSTARGLTRRYAFRGAERAKLYNPELNMELGQRYLSQLLKYPYIDGNIFRVATAYNGGPGNLRSWSRRINHDDPLIFIESIPVRESRQFVKHIATNLWVYRERLEQEAPTLAHAAIGAIPRYTKRDGIILEAQKPEPVQEADSKSSFWSFFGFN